MLTLRSPVLAPLFNRNATTLSFYRKHTAAFTIVELLIVVVIIAILAAVTIVSYNGIQTRATNTAIIDAASKTLRMLESYIAVNGKYPTSVNGEACVTSTTGCMDATSTFTANATFDTNIATVGSVPRSTPNTGTNAYGIRYNYSSTRTYNGVLMPVVIQYFLLGSSQQCSLPDVTASNWTAAVSSTTGYYNSGTFNGVVKTQCIISVPGPSA